MTYQPKLKAFKAPHQFLIATLLLIAAGSLISPSTALAMTNLERQNLVKLFECQPAVDYSLLDKTMETYGISPSAERFKLKRPLMVFGLPITTISIFRESGEDAYRVYPRGLSEQEMIAAARLTKHKWGYQRTTKAGVISVENYEGLYLQCSVVTESEY